MDEGLISINVLMFYLLHEKVQSLFGGLFEKYGMFIARYPWAVICIVTLLDLSLGTGMLQLQTRERGLEQYTPIDSEASMNREEIRKLFKDNSSSNFYSHNLPDFGHYVSVIVIKEDGGNILNVSSIQEMTSLYSYITNIRVYDTTKGCPITYKDVCAKRFSNCVIDGDFIFHPQFAADILRGQVRFPEYKFLGNNIYINSVIGGAKTNGKYLTTSKAIKLRFNIRKDVGHQWELECLEQIPLFRSSDFNVKYSYSESIQTELDKTLNSDLFLIFVAFLFIVLFSVIMLVGGNCVVNRAFLAFAGIINTGLAIVAAIGLNSYCGVKFVNTVGAVPFLVLGIGIDDMFVLLSGLASTSPSDDIPTRIGKTMRHSGMSITITSLTDVVAFCIGATSIFPSVKYFSIYAVSGILLCYLNFITFFLGCLTINEVRVMDQRHCFTCMKVPRPEVIDKAGESTCKKVCCSGEQTFDKNSVESPVEKYLKVIIKKLVLNLPSQIIICMVFLAYLAVSIWGVTEFKEGLNFKDLFLPDSYYTDFYETDQNYFSQTLSISLNFHSPLLYDQESTFERINELVEEVKNDTYIENGFLLSWIHSYKASGFVNASSNFTFIDGLQSFLNSPYGNIYANDVVIDRASNTVSASRIHVLSTDLKTSNEQADFMIRIRNIVKRYDLPVFAYSPAFIIFENYAEVYLQTVQTLGICVAAVFGVTMIFIPLPTILFLVTINVVLIMLGVIGFMHFWGLTLSSITMIYIISSIGFCIDFTTHICHAFVEAKGSDRKSRAIEAIDTAGGAVFNGAMSTVVGLVTLSLSSAQIFISLIKVMFLVMMLGLAHALFLLPIMLLLLGPVYNKSKAKETKVNVEPAPAAEENSK